MHACKDADTTQCITCLAAAGAGGLGWPHAPACAAIRALANGVGKKNALLAMGRYGQSVWGGMCNVTT